MRSSGRVDPGERGLWRGSWRRASGPGRDPAHDPWGLTPAPGADAGFQEMTAVQFGILGVSRGLHDFLIVAGAI